MKYARNFSTGKPFVLKSIKSSLITARILLPRVLPCIYLMLHCTCFRKTWKDAVLLNGVLLLIFQKNCFMKCWELTRRTRVAQSPGPNTNPGFLLSLDPSLGFYIDLGHSTTNGRVVKILIIRAYAHKIIDWSGVNW